MNQNIYQDPLDVALKRGDAVMDALLDEHERHSLALTELYTVPKGDFRGAQNRILAARRDLEQAARDYTQNMRVADERLIGGLDALFRCEWVHHVPLPHIQNDTARLWEFFINRVRYAHEVAFTKLRENVDRIESRRAGANHYNNAVGDAIPHLEDRVRGWANGIDRIEEVWRTLQQLRDQSQNVPPNQVQPLVENRVQEMTGKGLEAFLNHNYNDPNP